MLSPNAKFLKLLVYAALLLVILPGAGCREISSLFFDRMTEPDPCDAGANVYRGETHFIERDFLREDGTIDYDKWLRITDPGLSPCDPLNTRKALEAR